MGVSKSHYENSYYLEMPAFVSESADLRNEGIRLVREDASHSERRRGFDLLEQSVEELVMARGRYGREYFASQYMLSRAFVLRGDFELAGNVALDAMAVLPEVPAHLRDEVVADQYVAIASGRLSLILSSFNIGILGEPEYAVPYLEAASEAASLARRTCRFSENPERMLFTDGSMTEDERKTARRRHELTAVAATAGLWLPGLGNRRAVTRKMCA